MGLTNRHSYCSRDLFDTFRASAFPEAPASAISFPRVSGSPKEFELAGAECHQETQLGGLYSACE